MRAYASKLGRAAAEKTRLQVEKGVAGARDTAERSLDRLGEAIAESGEGVKRQMSLFGRGLEVGLRAGVEAYRKKGRVR